MAALESIPKDLRGLRACLVCSMIKSFEEFEKNGCDNCEEFLNMKDDKDSVYDHTSNNFDGMVAMMSPTESWVAKWQHVTPFTRGMYAISVSGSLPAATLRHMKKNGIPYRSRDISHS